MQIGAVLIHQLPQSLFDVEHAASIGTRGSPLEGSGRRLDHFGIGSPHNAETILRPLGWWAEASCQGFFGGVLGPPVIVNSSAVNGRRSAAYSSTSSSLAGCARTMCSSTSGAAHCVAASISSPTWTPAPIWA